MRRLAALAALAAALLIPLATVSADTFGPTGQYVRLDKTTFCDAGQPCLGVSANLEVIGKVASACVSVFTTDGTIFTTETGCLESGVNVIVRDKFVVGFGDTEFTLDDGEGNTRTAVISALTTVGVVTKQAATISFDAGGGCTTTQRVKYDSALLDGTITIDSTAIASDGSSWNLTNHEKTRCA